MDKYYTVDINDVKTCGHKHKTREAAERCREKLCRGDCIGGSMGMAYCTKVIEEYTPIKLIPHRKKPLYMM